MEYQLSNKQLQDIERAFNYIDLDKDGRIHAKDLPDLFKILGQNPTSQEDDEIEAKFSADATGFDVDQVVAIVRDVGLKSKEEVYDELKMAFKAIDEDGDGCITKQELSTYMKRVGDPMSQEEIDEMMELADVDKNGIVDWNEFVTVLCQHIM